jgi:large subunit ribosomal protein L5
MAVPRLKARFVKEVVSSLKDKFQYKSVMQVPKITKIVINKGVGAAVSDKKLIDVAVEEITQIAGQKAVAPIGVKVTLRGDRMYEFLDRLTTVSLPRVRDFKGVSEKGFDGRGNYTLGVKEQIIFPEISIDKVAKISGMDITFVTSAKTDEEAYALLVAVGMPFSNIKK